ncbi:MAG TPA: GAF domain-containing sensor histidine kinase, partial [Labilithrix sp.]|nr:GAF domain-containing sensor histidine kinase [Labilithrix sp.]
VLRSGQPVLLVANAGDHVDSYFQDTKSVPVVRDLGSRSIVAVPLIAHDRMNGVMTFGSAAPCRYSSADVEMYGELGRRAALALDNARLFKEAEDAVRVRDEFLSVAAHELNTPLTSLKLMIQAISRGPLLASAEKLKSGLLLADRQIRRLTRLVDELLDVSRMHAGRLTLQLERVELTQVVSDTIEQLSGAIAQSGSAVSLRAPKRVVGTWDRLRLEQVVANLLSNAIKFGAGKPVEIAVSQVGRKAVLSVRDHGIGITPDRISQVFGRFERAVSSRSYGGLGLGLYIAHVIVSALGGTISVESVVGEGSTFVVELPRTEGHHDG